MESTSKMNARTTDRVQSEMKSLLALLRLVPPRSFFGDDNRAVIRAQYRVLADNMSLATVKAVFPESRQSEQFRMHHAAMDALEWLSDPSSPMPAPSSTWAELCPTPPVRAVQHHRSRECQALMA